MTGIPTATISRLVTYLRTLERAEADIPYREAHKDGTYYINSTEIAEKSGNSAFQVRKDMAYAHKVARDLGFSEPLGKRGSGYKILVLKRTIMSVLGLNQTWNVVIVGMGRLGQAIANYPGASDYQFQYVGLFDVNPDLVGTQVRGLTVRHVDDLREFVRTIREETRVEVDMGFLAVPPERAQDAAQSLADAGVRGILNFAPVVIQPRTVERSGQQEISDEWRGVIVENVDFLAGMKRLAFYSRNPHPKAADPEENA